LIGELGQRLRIFVELRGEEMRRRHVAQKIEPEYRKLRQHPALVRNAGGQNVVECGDAIGGDDEELAVDAIHVAHLAAAVALDARQVGL